MNEILSVTCVRPHREKAVFLASIRRFDDRTGLAFMSSLNSSFARFNLGHFACAIWHQYIRHRDCPDVEVSLFLWFFG